MSYPAIVDTSERCKMYHCLVVPACWDRPLSGYHIPPSAEGMPSHTSIANGRWRCPLRVPVSFRCGKGNIHKTGRALRSIQQSFRLNMWLACDSASRPFRSCDFGGSNVPPRLSVFPNVNTCFTATARYASYRLTLNGPSPTTPRASAPCYEAS
jgi:hypothetical protein